jgi:hypothetical protein
MAQAAAHGDSLDRSAEAMQKQMPKFRHLTRSCAHPVDDDIRRAMRDLPRQDKRRDLTIKEAAWCLSVSYYWLWRRIGTKEGPLFKKRGRLVILPREGFVAWAACLKGPKAETSANTI